MGGVIAYADDIKRTLLGVRPETLAAHGAVSEGVSLLSTVVEGHAERWERATSLVRKARIWTVLEGAAIEDFESGKMGRLEP